MPGDYWVPYAISVGDNVIRVFDEQIHQAVAIPGERPGMVDPRWIRIRRPLVIVGGELTLDLLDLVYIASQRYHEAPPHLKANGGVFLVDDFGRERVSPEQLLNRFITPMEHHVRLFHAPHRSKNSAAAAPRAHHRHQPHAGKGDRPGVSARMGYRVFLGPPTPEQYARIFQSYAQRQGATVAAEAIENLLERYRAQNRELRSCEPRDLIERARDICRFHGRPLELTTKVLDLAWAGYFGTEYPGQDAKGTA